MSPNPRQVQHVGMSWYRRDQYERVLAIMADAHVLPASFEAWEKQASKRLQELERDGLTVHRAIIDPDTFPAWCVLRGLDVDAQARMAFGADYARRQLGD